jgi:predicted transposase
MNELHTLSCRLNIVPQQRGHLEDTLEAFAAACNNIWTYGVEHQTNQQWALHQGCYKTIRKLYSIPASLAIRAIARVAIDLKVRRPGAYPYAPNFIAFDSRSFILHKQDWSAGLTLLHGREKFHLDLAKRQQSLLEGCTPASTVLLKKYRSFYLEFNVGRTTHGLSVSGRPSGVQPAVV